MNSIHDTAEWGIIEERLKEALPAIGNHISKMYTHLLKAGGKRLRPKLVMLSGNLFSKTNEELILTAVVSELIHMASLVHDDIIDKAKVRRGYETINNKWGNKHSVLTGDFIFARAFNIMSKHRLSSVMDLMVESIEEMCDGEIMQADKEFDLNENEEEYLSIVYKKTACFLGNCCKGAAIVSGADEESKEKVYEFGLNLGFAFQIADDILNINGDPNIMGKARGSDLIQGNITLPVINLMKDKKYKLKIHESLNKGYMGEEFSSEISEEIIKTGALRETIIKARSFQEKALDALSGLPHAPSKLILEKITKDIIGRRL